MRYLISILIAALVIGVGLFALPYEWLNPELRKIRVDLLGPPSWKKAKTVANVEQNEEGLFPVCDITQKEDRAERTLEGITVSRSRVCEPDSPELVAASVVGTNLVSHATLMSSGLSSDAVVKGRDLDNDGDPDEIDIVLEVIELNGFNSDTGSTTVTYDIAPGVSPTAWIFAPKTLGMSTESFDSDKAIPLMRLPAPVIRVEQGDVVNITLENTHFLPHTIHFHGVDHPFLKEDGTGNDGVPLTSEKPVQPTSKRTYSFKPRQPGTYFYHCHVHPDAHIVAGLQGMIIVEEQAPNNRVQSLNVGGGHVRYPSVSVKERFDNEFDLHYQDMDRELSERMRFSNDPEKILKSVNIDYDVANSKMDYFLLNGKSFPYTFRESIVFIAENELVLLRVLNGGSESIAIHTHGHKTKIIAADGVSLVEPLQQFRDVHHIAPAQRIDLELDSTNDGLRSYGSGTWIFHDHFERGVTTGGVSPGGNLSAIVYEDYLDEKNWPITFGLGWNKYFDPKYYQNENKIPLNSDALDFFKSIFDEQERTIMGFFGVFSVFVLVVGFYRRGRR
ncbi:MAG: multicopper oxidase domain-containing protein [Pseudomonadales bacterium]|nr:multicopper oxidase domain-containing protein [Pseudomonadales bacterium]